MYSTHHESTHLGYSLLCVHFSIYLCHVEFAVVVLVVKGNDCVKMLVSWLRGRGGGVFTMIAPSVQGIA